MAVQDLLRTRAYTGLVIGEGERDDMGFSAGALVCVSIVSVLLLKASEGRMYLPLAHERGHYEHECCGGASFHVTLPRFRIRIAVRDKTRERRCLLTIRSRALPSLESSAFLRVKENMVGEVYVMICGFVRACAHLCYD